MSDEFDCNDFLPDSTAVAGLQPELEGILRGAVVAALGCEFADTDPLIVPAKDPKFGDFQANCAMGLAKRLSRKPRDVAAEIAGAICKGNLIESIDVAGPGFINLCLSLAALGEQLNGMRSDSRLGVPAAVAPQTVVVDYCAPNMAKEMHIGNFRSMCIGDAIVRVLEFAGHHVIRQNHLGDWGTQFGMLVEHLIDTDWVKSDDQGISDLDALYRQSKQRFDSDPVFAQRARQRVVALQGGDKQSMDYWRMLIDESVHHMNGIFQRIGVRLVDDDIRPESFYNAMLSDVIDRLDQAGQLQESQGAKVAYPEGYSDRDGNPFPMIVRKSDGGYLYATTDLAAATYRTDTLEADRVIYVVDSRQSQHLAMVFQVVRQADLVDDSVRFDHVAFGTIQGKDRKPFKTREGEAVKLSSVLDEAERRARAIIQDKGSVDDPQLQEQIARVVGMGAIKYFDLANDRIKDYVFDWDHMLALEGNSAPYLLNAYVRVQSIFRKGGVDADDASGFALQIREPQERALALQLLQLPQVIAVVADSLEPHRLCNYLYELASSFHQFFEHCRVLQDDDEATRESRLALCELVARTLKQGLELLGIEVVERM